MYGLINGVKGHEAMPNAPHCSANYVCLRTVALEHLLQPTGIHKRVLTVTGTVVWPEVSEYVSQLEHATIPYYLDPKGEFVLLWMSIYQRNSVT